jgi:hypothetical protein
VPPGGHVEAVMCISEITVDEVVAAVSQRLNAGEART